MRWLVLPWLVACAPAPQPADTTPDTDVPVLPAPAYADGTQEVLDLADGVRVLSRNTTTPRPLRFHLVLIDPTAPGLTFFVTPPNGPDAPRETDRQTARAFVEDHDLTAAINAHFFAPWPAEDGYADLLGLSASDGTVYSPFEDGWSEAFVVDEAGVPHLVTHDPAGGPTATQPPVSIRHAVGATERILDDGAVVATWDELHPRTAVGLTPDRTVVFAVVDGRQDGVSEGVTTPELAALMQDVGVVDAINLDGGGSSTLAVADPAPRVLNTPVGLVLPGTERLNGSHLGVRAAR